MPVIWASASSDEAARTRQAEQVKIVRKLLAEAGTADQEIKLCGELGVLQRQPELKPEPGTEFQAFQALHIRLPADKRLGLWMDTLFAHGAQFDNPGAFSAREEVQTRAAAQARQAASVKIARIQADYHALLQGHSTLGPLRLQETIDHNTGYHTQITPNPQGELAIPLGAGDVFVRLDAYLDLPVASTTAQTHTITFNELASQPAAWKEVQGYYQQRSPSMAALLAGEEKAFLAAAKALQALGIALTDIYLNARHVEQTRPDPVFLSGQDAALTPDPDGFASQRSLRVRVRDVSKLVQVKAILEANDINNIVDYLWGVDDDTPVQSQARWTAMQKALAHIRTHAQDAPWQITQIEELAFTDVVCELQSTDTAGNTLEGRAANGVSLSVSYQIG